MKTQTFLVQSIIFRWLPVFLVGLLGFSSCNTGPERTTEPSETVDLTIAFKGTFGDAPLRMYEGEYAYEDNTNIRLQLFQFYVSNFYLQSLEKSTPDSLSLIDIDLVSFRDIISQEDAERGVEINIPDVPVGTYHQLQMGLGVAPAYNATQPGDYTPPHPLDDHYWSWARGYVFAKVEGNVDYDRDGTYDEKLTFHLGENDFYRTLRLEQPIVIGPSNTSLTFTVDLERVLKDGQGEFVDFRQVTQDHTNDMDLVGFLMDNLQAAITLEQ